MDVVGTEMISSLLADVSGRLFAAEQHMVDGAVGAAEGVVNVADTAALGALETVKKTNAQVLAEARSLVEQAQAMVESVGKSPSA